MGTKINRLVVAIAWIGMFLFIPMPSNAAVIPVDELSFTGTGLSKSVSISVGTLTGSVMAGFYNVALTVTSDPVWTGTYNGFAFCAEAQRPITPGSYTAYFLFDVIPPFTNAAWLMSNYLQFATTNDSAASLQVAIWEAILDPTSFNLGAGNFQLLTGLDPTLANVMLAALGSADLSSFNTDAYRIASDDGLGFTFGYQDFIVKNNAVPIPSALLLLGSGLIGFIGLRRKLAGRYFPTANGVS